MLITNEVTLTRGGITYVLKKGFEQIDANGTLAKKATYELTQSSSIHGSSREAIIGLLELKFDLPRTYAEQIIAHLDNAAEQEMLSNRKHTDAPILVGGGIPTRPLATVN